MATGGQVHQPGAGDMIGVTMRVEHRDQMQVEFLDQRMVAEMLLEHGIDDYRLPALRVTEQVGIGR